MPSHVMACYFYIMFTMCIPAIQTMDTNTCKDGDYLDTKSATCIPCTTSCPGDQVIRRTCGPYRDAECGPLVELSAFFKQLSDSERSKAADQAQITSSVAPEMHVASLDGSAHEADTLLHALLLVLLFLTALIIVLTAVALAMYRRRNSQSRKDPDPECEVSSLGGQQVLEVLEVTNPGSGSLVLVTQETALLKPDK